MKSIVKFFILLSCTYLLDACKEANQKGEKPAPLVAYDATPIHGGAIITYSIPEDPNILYVMAEYERNGKSFVERASIYVNSLTIQGFNTMEPVSAKLYTVNDNETRSEPLKIDFTPLESPVSLAFKSANIISSFGGITVSWENITQTELSVCIMIEEDGVMIEKDMYFSSRENEIYPFRGFESVETIFALTFEDKWKNVSDTVYFTGTPLFEILVPKPWIDIRGTLPYDNVSGILSDLWNNSYGFRDASAYLTTSGSKGSSFTFDFGQVVKLSLMTLWPYVQDGNFTAPVVVYGNLNVLAFEMWGTKAIDPSRLFGDPSYWLHPNSAMENGLELPAHTFMDDWVYLGRYEVERLDLQGTATENEMFAKAAEGYQYEFSLECESVRIIRFFPLCSSTGCPISNNWWRIGELSFWGDNSVPQE